MSNKNTVSLRQKKFIENRKHLGFKKVQVYLSNDVYEMLDMMKSNNTTSKSTYASIIESSISSEFINWSKSMILKD